MKKDDVKKKDPALPPDYQVTKQDQGHELEEANEESLHNAYRNRKRVVTKAGPAKPAKSKERKDTRK